MPLTKANTVLTSLFEAQEIPIQEGRPETIKLAPFDWLALLHATVTSLDANHSDPRISRADLRGALVKAVGEARTTEIEEAYLALLTGRQSEWAKGESPQITKYDTMRIAEELEPLVPGITDEDRARWLVKRLSIAFPGDDNHEKRVVLLNYAYNRITEAAINPPQPPQEPETEPETDNDTESFLKAARWLRHDPSGAGAKVVAELRGVRWVGGTNHQFDASGISGWPEGSMGPGINAVCCLFVERNGTWEGGKYDWLRNPPTTRNTNNVGGYLAVSPRSGETVRFVLIDVRGRQATNYVEAVWP